MRQEDIIVAVKEYLDSSKQSGEHFNIFEVIDATTDEVKVHSAFLAELLSPQGRHGQGSVFLELFVKQFRVQPFNAKHAYVTVEHYIGPKEGDAMTKPTGGRIDLLIQDNMGNHIVIENKIYASDEEYQLLRYSNKYPDNIFYLTLDGRLPLLPSSTRWGEQVLEAGRDYRCLSYQKDITEWLQHCIEVVKGNYYLQASITQYLRLIEILTCRPISEERMKLKQVIKENLEAACSLNEVVNEIKTDIQMDFWLHLQKALRAVYPNVTAVSPDKVRNYYTIRQSRDRIISIEIPVYACEDFEVVWVAAVDWRFHTGFKVKKDTEILSHLTDFDELRRFVRGSSLGYDCAHKDSAEWLGWRYESKEGLNFWKFNSPVMFSLAGEDFRKLIISHIVETAVADIAKVLQWIENSSSLQQKQ